MTPTHSEPVRGDPKAEIRIGKSSWSAGKDESKSIKYTWFDKNGKACRGGEFPIEALPQMLEFAIRTGNLKLST